MMMMTRIMIILTIWMIMLKTMMMMRIMYCLELVTYNRLTLIDV